MADSLGVSVTDPDRTRVEADRQCRAKAKLPAARRAGQARNRDGCGRGAGKKRPAGPNFGPWPGHNSCYAIVVLRPALDARRLPMRVAMVKRVSWRALALAAILGAAFVAAVPKAEAHWVHRPFVRPWRPVFYRPWRPIFFRPWPIFVPPVRPVVIGPRPIIVRRTVIVRAPPVVRERVVYRPAPVYHHPVHHYHHHPIHYSYRHCGCY